VSTRFLFLLLIGVTCYSHAQQNSTVIGARVNAMGYAASCEQNVWSLFGNPAGIASTSQAESFFTYEAMPSFPGFNRMAAGIVLPAKLGVAGAGVYRFGDDLYNEQILSAAFANTMGLASLGVRGNVVQYNAEGFGTKHLFTVSLGGLVQFTPWLWVGAFIVNVNQPKIESSQRVPTRLYIGIAAQPSSHCFITAEVEKDLDMKALLKAGLEYEVHRKVSLRTGLNLFPGAGYAGVGFKPAWFRLDYAFSFIPVMGAKHQASVTYPFNKHKK
jgi:hypothetical protein